jgi:catechol 2,3-dioxygenase-like lactoylglutathione lyase family enzyme
VKGSFQHVQFNVAHPATSLPFYKDLLTYLEMQVVLDETDMLGVSDGNVSFWFLPAEKDHVYDRDGAGMNHLGIGVASKGDVDGFYSGFMKPRGIAAQWETPRARPEFGNYYQVMFEDPEGLAIEVFHAE